MEDGERHARRAATLRPDSAPAAALVVEALARQRGREEDTIAVAADAVRRCGGLRDLAADGAADALRAVVAAVAVAVTRRGGRVDDAVAALLAAAEGAGEGVERVIRDGLREGRVDD